MTKSIMSNSRRHRNLSEGDDVPQLTENSMTSSKSMENTHVLYQTIYTHTTVPVECFISLASDQLITVEVESKATGQDVIDKVCEKMGIVEESAYFGLQYRGKCHEAIWLNVRNRLSHQLQHTFPYRLDFRVKYFVLPHTIISNETRHQFYLNAKNLIIEGCWSHDVQKSDLYHVIALMAQSDFGNYHHSTSSMKYALFWPKTKNEDISSAGMKEISQFHQSLTDWSNTKCEYELLRLISENWIMYGVSFQDMSDYFGKPLKIGVGPEGVYLCSTKYGLIHKYVFDGLTNVNYIDKVVELETLRDDGKISREKYCLKSCPAAKSFQRFVTETHSFFKCETVDNDIIQHSKNHRHLFKKSNSCTDYMYDVTKTSREVYDSARRRAYSCSSNASPTKPDYDDTNEQNVKPESSHTNQKENVDDLKKELEILRELVQCIVCKYRKINRVFIPCMHIVCCEICAARLNQCPICRKEIQIRHHAYPRWINDNITVNDSRQTLCTLPEDRALIDAEQFDVEAYY